MKYTGTLICTRDIGKAIEFYRTVLGLEVVADFGANVTMSGGIGIQTIETWKGFINREEDEILKQSNAFELYFEEDNFDGFMESLKGFTGIEYVHDMIEHSWGQRVVRFYDPDRHIIEVGENMAAVVKRFIDGGMSVAEAAVRMDVPVEYIESQL